MNWDENRKARPDFFRVLAGLLAWLNVDALDALEREASQRITVPHIAWFDRPAQP